MSSPAAKKENEAAQNLGERLAGKYLTFSVASEEYGIEILKVQEIIRMQNITHIPKAPKFVRGVINLRGKVIPVVELRKKFNIETIEDTERTCIIVVRINVDLKEVVMGIIIDEVSEVLDIGAKNIDKTPSFGASVDTSFILGIGKVGDHVKILLDIDKVLSQSDVQSLAKIGEE